MNPLSIPFGKEGVVGKKSARLAEKRKLREESGPPISEDDYFFTPLTRFQRTSGARQSISPSLTRELFSPSARVNRQHGVGASGEPIPLLSHENYQNPISHGLEGNDSYSEDRGWTLLYVSRQEATTLSFPLGQEVPFSRKDPPPPLPLKVTCSISGCENSKKYTCSRTKAPLCSLACYKKNLMMATALPASSVEK